MHLFSKLLPCICNIQIRIMAIAKIVLLLFLAAFCVVAKANIPFNQKYNGDFTYYDDAGYGACGTQIDASRQMLVAISYEWFTSPNPNVDQFCTQNVCVRVDYNGRSVTVPVKDKCPSCTRNHLDLSKVAFAQLADLSVGHVYGATWQFVHC